MILRKSPVRSGITLTEILISILIMGVGLVSLATLFPLGLLRLREAQRQSRSGLLSNSANADMDAQALLYKPSFQQSWHGNNQRLPVAGVPNYDPFVEDTWPGATLLVPDPNNNVGPGSSRPLNPYNNAGSTLPIAGLPFCYDPLWRAVTQVPPNTVLGSSSLDLPANYTINAAEARFGCGNPRVGNSFVPFVRPIGSNPSAFGLQRITNFIPWTVNNSSVRWRLTCGNPFVPPQNQPPDLAGLTFASQDDMVFFRESENTILSTGVSIGQTSPVVPELDPTTRSTIHDWRYTWFITGRQLDATNGKSFEGEIVVCENRPFAFERLVSPVNTSAGAFVAAGETVVDAIFGYGNGSALVGANGMGYAAGGDRSVLLRWPSTLPDPEIKVGSWIADVTYERDLQVAGGPNATDNSSTQYGAMFRAGGPIYPSQRCYWYQVVRKTEVEGETGTTQAPFQVGYRRVVVTVNAPVRAKTLLTNGSGVPVFSNAALIMPSVVNVFPRTFQLAD